MPDGEKQDEKVLNLSKGHDSAGARLFRGIGTKSSESVNQQIDRF